MNLQQQERFYHWMTRLRENSRAASVPKDDKIITEVVDGLIVSKPANRIEHISEPAAKTSEPQAQAQAQAKVWNLTKDGPVLESKVGSAFAQQNKLQEIIRFYRSNGRL